MNHSDFTLYKEDGNILSMGFKINNEFIPNLGDNYYGVPFEEMFNSETGEFTGINKTLKYLKGSNITVNCCSGVPTAISP